MEYEVGDFASGEAYLERLFEAMPSAPPRPTADQSHLAFEIPCMARIISVFDQLDYADLSACLEYETPTSSATNQ